MRELTFDAVSNDPRHKTASRIKYILKLPKSLFDVYRWLVHLYKALELADCCKWFPHSNICLEAVRIWINLINSFIIELTNTANHDFSVINQIVCTFQLCTRVKPRAKEFSNTFFFWNVEIRVVDGNENTWLIYITLSFGLWAPGCWMSQLVNWMFDKDMEWLKFCLWTILDNLGGMGILYLTSLHCKSRNVIFGPTSAFSLSFLGLTRLIMVGHVQQTIVRYNGSTVSFLIKYPFRFSLHIYSFYKDCDESHVVYIYMYKSIANTYLKKKK